MTVLSTIGYEGASLHDFLATLQAAGVSKLIDVRELPISRRAGFAKKALAEALEAAGIRYVHLKGLGDPKKGRAAARAADKTTFLRVFSKHMRTPEAQADLERAIKLAVEGGACLMCYERRPEDCHRRLVADAISARVPISIRHLGVRNGIAASGPKNGA